MKFSIKAAVAAVVMGGAFLSGIVPAIADGHADQRYVMVVPISGHPFWVPIRQGAQDAADQLGVQFEFTGPVVVGEISSNG